MDRHGDEGQVEMCRADGLRVQRRIDVRLGPRDQDGRKTDHGS